MGIKICTGNATHQIAHDSPATPFMVGNSCPLPEDFYLKPMSKLQPSTDDAASFVQEDTLQVHIQSLRVR
jgi:hypothetical protein